MKLHNSYDLLTKYERMCVFLRAASRGDTRETQAVIKASPRLEIKLIDFAPDLYASMLATVFHCLSQVNLFVAISHLWDDRDNDESFLCARLWASRYVVSEEAWRLICKEDGVDYDKLLKTWGESMYLNRAAFFRLDEKTGFYQY